MTESISSNSFFKVKLVMKVNLYGTFWNVIQIFVFWPFEKKCNDKHYALACLFRSEYCCQLERMDIFHASR